MGHSVQEWHHVAPMTIGRIMPGIAVLNGKIFVVGGEMESQILANGEQYDPLVSTRADKFLLYFIGLCCQLTIKNISNVF